MNFEVGESKIYFKPIASDEEYKELSGAKELKIETNEKTIKNDFIENSKKEISLNVELKMGSFEAIKKMLGFKNLKSKRFKKLLMSVGFDRNEAECINNLFKYNGQKRYSYFIDIYESKINGIKYYIRKMR